MPSAVKTIEFDGLVCDLDGVVYRGDDAIPGAVDTVNELRRRGVRVVFCTNNSRSTVTQYQHKLDALGIDSSDEDIVTSAVVTGEVFRQRNMGGAGAIVVGGDGVLESLRTAGLRVLGADDDSRADVVVVGYDPEFDYSAMRRSALAVRAGAHLVATNDDASFPAADGLWPGAGAILASIERATGARAEVMGKPNPPMMDAVARRLQGCRRIAIVGDRAETDLRGGMARGWMTILVTSGVVSPDDAAALDPQPDVTLGSLAELVNQ
jgi:phosphoglycolate/pyridoxal phosphate phosphatase family enzyme